MIIRAGLVWLRNFIVSLYSNDEQVERILRWATFTNTSAFCKHAVKRPLTDFLETLPSRVPLYCVIYYIWSESKYFTFYIT